MITRIPKDVSHISSALSHAGFENYLVGGCVRDLIIGKIPKDWDFATNATPEEIQKIFPKSFYENEFGTVGVKTDSAGVVEITPYRLESDYSDRRHPNQIKWAKNIEEDLGRRDFTINAMALALELKSRGSRQERVYENKIIDPFGGQEDIKKKVIRAVGKPDERFQEDALRMLRAIRLSSELGFAIEFDTQEAIARNAALIAHISRERIRDEFEKIIMSESPAQALELAMRLGIIKFISPEFERGVGIEQNKAHAYTVWEHLLRTLDHAAKKKYPLHVRLAALFHDIAKPHTRAWKNNQWTFYGHEVLGARLTKSILEDLRFPKEIVEKTAKLVRWHMFFSDTEAITLSAVRRLVRNVGPDLIWDLMNVRASDRVGTGRPKEYPYRLRKYQAMIKEAMRDPISVKQLSLNGQDIMRLTETGPGPHIGFILDILLSEVLEDPKKNDRELLEQRVLELNKLPPKELERLGLLAREKNRGEDEKEIIRIRQEYGVK